MTNDAVSFICHIPSRREILVTTNPYKKVCLMGLSIDDFIIIEKELTWIQAKEKAILLREAMGYPTETFGKENRHKDYMKKYNLRRKINDYELGKNK